MMRHSYWSESTRPAAFGFLAVCALVVACAVGQRAGYLDASTARRVSGILVGLLAIVTGNFVPKLRPLAATTSTAATVAATERLAGWVLVAIGVAFVGLFALTPLVMARMVTPFVALGGLALVAGAGVRAALLSRRDEAPDGRGDSAAPGARREQRRVAGWLLFAITYVLVTASLKWLAPEDLWIRGFGAWVLLACTGVYSILVVLVQHRRRRA